jgi:hypothetical protein
MQTAQEQIASILYNPNFLIPGILALLIGGGLFIALVSLAVLAARFRPSIGPRIEQFGMLALIGSWLVGIFAAGMFFYNVEVKGSRTAAAEIIRLARLPAEKRMIFVDGAGRVTISERASAINDRGELVIFRRGNTSVPLADFPEVWKLAGGTSTISPTTLTLTEP